MISSIQHQTILASSVETTPGSLIIHLQEGTTVPIAWQHLPGKLQHASAVQRECLELSPGGYGIHWPLLDEDLSIKGIVQITQTCTSANEKH
jgi:hypothetical protein